MLYGEISITIVISIGRGKTMLAILLVVLEEEGIFIFITLF